MRQPFFTLLMSGFRCRIGTFRCVYGVAFFVFIADRRNGLYDLDLAVAEFAERELDLAYDVGGRPVQGLVDDGDVALFEVEAPQVECLLHQQK